ncbi:MAG: hypothetical protein AAF629_21195 [Chloroflexota bacterium]
MRKLAFSLQFFWGLSIVSIALNIALLFGLNVMRQTAIDALAQAEVLLHHLAEVPLTTEVSLAATDSSVVQLETVEFQINQTSLMPLIQQTSGEITNLIGRLAPGRQPLAWPENDAVSPPMITIEASMLRDVSIDPSQDETGSTSDTASVSHPPINNQSAIVVDTTTPNQPASQSAAEIIPIQDLGACAHEYWPLRPGMRWDFNSHHTAYTYQVDELGSNQVFLSSEYEGQPLRYDIVCYQEGLGGTFLGDMRRLTEFGDLTFANPRGVFLPSADLLNQGGVRWEQVFDVFGTVQVLHKNRPLQGNVREGEATAEYSTTNFELLDTPFGPQEALRIEQNLKINLDIDYGVDGQTVRGNKSIKFQTDFWFVKGIGLVKTQWGGGPIWHVTKLNDLAEQQQIPIPALPEETLISICMPTNEGDEDCLFTLGYSDRDWAAPPLSEIELGVVNLPVFADTLVAQAGTDDATNPDIEDETATPENDSSQSDDNPRRDSDDSSKRDEMAAYLRAIDDMRDQISAPGQDFYKSAIAYRLDNITLEEFADIFQSFSKDIRSPINTFKGLSPPNDAKNIHQTLSDGLDKCTSAMDALEDWLQTQDDDLKDQGMDDAEDCLTILQSADDELDRLTSGL